MKENFQKFEFVNIHIWQMLHFSNKFACLSFIIAWNTWRDFHSMQHEKLHLDNWFLKVFAMRHDQKVVGYKWEEVTRENKVRLKHTAKIINYRSIHYLFNNFMSFYFSCHQEKNVMHLFNFKSYCCRRKLIFFHH